jgi:hypothetical protein
MLSSRLSSLELPVGESNDSNGSSDDDELDFVVHVRKRRRSRPAILDSGDEDDDASENDNKENLPAFRRSLPNHSPSSINHTSMVDAPQQRQVHSVPTRTLLRLTKMNSQGSFRSSSVKKVKLRSNAFELSDNYDDRNDDVESRWNEGVDIATYTYPPSLPTLQSSTKENWINGSKAYKEPQQYSPEVVDLCASDDDDCEEVHFGTRAPVRSPPFNYASRNFFGPSKSTHRMSATSQLPQQPPDDHVQYDVLEGSGHTNDTIHSTHSTAKCTPLPTPRLSATWYPPKALPPPTMKDTYKSDASRKRQRLRQASDPYKVSGIVAKKPSEPQDFHQVASNLWFRPKVTLDAPARWMSAPSRNDISGGSGVGAGNFVLERNNEFPDVAADAPRETKKTRRKAAPKTGEASKVAKTKAASKESKATRKAGPKKPAKGKKKGGWRRNTKYRSKGAASRATAVPNRDPWGDGYQHRTAVPRSDADLQHVGGATISF